MTMSLLEMVKRAREDADALRFMRHFDNKRIWQKLLLVHKKQVFESFEFDNRAKPLTWFGFDSFGTGPGFQDAFSTMLMDLDHTDVQDAWLNRNMPSVKEEFWPHVEEVVFTIFEFIRSRTQLKEFVNAPALSREMVREILRNPSDLCIGEFLAQTITNSESLFDGGIQNTLDRIIDHGLNDPGGVFKL